MATVAEVASSADAPLSIDAIEERLVAAARHYHADEADISRWLLEVESRALYRLRGFSSLGDYALELTGISPRKAQYLVFIARRLKSLPRLSRAFDTGELSWTKARMIVRVATPSTELEWLQKTRLGYRELAREVREVEGREGAGFATLTLSIPVELLDVWNDCYELAERVSGCDLEKFQVLEPMMAEFLTTYLGVEQDGLDSIHATDEEKDIPPEVRAAVLKRDGYQCVVPGCSMRRMLDLHHLKFRSRRGTHDPDNVVCICRIHHGLIHRGICRLSGTVGVDLKFERPRLFTEKAPHVDTVIDDGLACEREEEDPSADPEDIDDAWRDGIVFATPDCPDSPGAKGCGGDSATCCFEWERRRDLEHRAARRRRFAAFVRSRGKAPNESGNERGNGSAKGGKSPANTCSSGGTDASGAPFTTSEPPSVDSGPGGAPGADDTS